MKHYGISAEAFIGWIRIARPGSVLGPQQYYLAQSEPNSPQKPCGMSPSDKKIAMKGEGGQGNYLVEAKERNSPGKRSITRTMTKQQSFKRQAI